MPTYSVEQRELWQTIVTYNIEAESEEQAQELSGTGTQPYEEHEILNRDCLKILNIHQTRLQ